MTLTFISNYINHHQLPFCDACHRILGDDFIFIQTEPMAAERLAMGWDNTGETRSYVIHLYGTSSTLPSNPEERKAFFKKRVAFSVTPQCPGNSGEEHPEFLAGPPESDEESPALDLILQSDVLLAGWTEDAAVLAAVQERIIADKPTFLVSERIYKSGRRKIFSPRGLVRNYKERTRHRRRPYYLLCIGAHTAADFRLLGAFPQKKFRWGYFPATIHHGEELWEQKKAAPAIRVCWAGRFIPLKRPEYMMQLARDLKRSGRHGVIDMVGAGEMEEELKDMAAAYGVSEAVHFHGFCPPERVREIMAAAHVFVLSSNNIEGWGAVLNEAMNAGCAVVASRQAGATGYLIKDGENGFSYPGRRYQKMREIVFKLCDEPDLRENCGRAAYKTITETWNAEQAAQALIAACKQHPPALPNNAPAARQDIVPPPMSPIT